MVTNFLSESNAVATWQNTDEQPVVSLVCVTYLHASFILETLYCFIRLRAFSLSRLSVMTIVRQIVRKK